MKYTAVVFLALFINAATFAEPRVTYAGQGRYACSGSVKECEPILRRNDELELQRQQAKELELQRRELQKLTELYREEQRRNETDGSARR